MILRAQLMLMLPALPGHEVAVRVITTSYGAIPDVIQILHYDEAGTEQRRIVVSLLGQHLYFEESGLCTEQSVIKDIHPSRIMECLVWCCAQLAQSILFVLETEDQS
ncbi:hypothetical protein HGA91_05640 [candidate division WWE3 bacterium]|nr:hypothetical protein [candidate division WWE3 bacterium]